MADIKPEIKALKVDDQVVVILGKGLYSGKAMQSEPISAVIKKAGPVWLLLTEKTSVAPRTWRMRRDTQQENVTSSTPGGGIYQAMFRTLEQHAAVRRLDEAYKTLREHGIDTWHLRTWTDEQIIKLAAAVWRIREPEVTSCES